MDGQDKETIITSINSPIRCCLDQQFSYGAFLSQRGTPSSHPFLDGMFHEIKQPAIGKPPDNPFQLVELPQWDTLSLWNPLLFLSIWPSIEGVTTCTDKPL